MQIINETAKLPPFALWAVRKTLKWIPPLDLQGIECILLRAKCPEPSENSSKLYKHAYHNNFTIYAEYVSKTESTPAKVYLYIQDIYHPIPYLTCFSPMPTLLIAQGIAHEVGHHLVRTRGYVFTPDEKYPDYRKKPAYEEEMVDRYAFGIVQNMREKLCYKLGAYLIRFFSDWYYGLAVARWEAKRYKEAADNWYKSFLLNPERQESVEWYWHSRRKLEKEKRDD